MPGLKGALSIRVSDGVTDRLVTRYCRGLKFTKTAPGGHRDLSFTMVVPRNTFTDLGPQDRVYVYDARTARTVIEGYIENPTPVDGPEGQQYEIHAMGGQALLNDETRGLIYIDRDLGAFERAADSTKAGDIEAGEWPDNNFFRCISTVYPSGVTVASGGYVSAGNYTFDRAGMNLGGVRVGNIDGGKTDGNWAADLVTTTGTVATGALTVLAGTLDIYVGATNFPTGTQRFALRLRRTGAATNVADDTTFIDWADFSAIGQRMNRNGTLLTGSGGLVSAGEVKANQVVEDLLGRLLTFCDPDTAQVDVTTFGITQLAYPDGVKAAGVLNDLSVFEPDLVWEILESLDNGKHRFNYRAWPTTPRYEVSVRDGWRQTGSDVDLCNRIVVSYTDAAGKVIPVPVTAASLGLVGIGLPVDALGARVKDADPVTLPEGLGSLVNATRIGGQILTDKINPPKAGTVLVRRPIMDRLTGNRVMPWEIETGYPAQIRETGDILRITQADYDDDPCSMLLTLGTPVLTPEQRIARLGRPGTLLTV